MVAAALALSGCGGEEATAPGAEVLTAQPLAVRTVDWNPKAIPVGKVAAVAELGGTTAVLAEAGATILSGGVLAANDTSVTGWQEAATIPAADKNGTWIAGIDGTGRVLRLRAGTFFEDVSDLYGLTGTAITGFAAVGEAAVAFSLAGELAVANGQNVTRYDGDFWSPIAGGGGRAASAGNGRVNVFEVATAKAYYYELAGAEDVVFDAVGRLVVRTKDSIYTEVEGGGLVLRYTSESGSIRDLAPSDVRVWFVDGGELAAFGSNSVLKASGSPVAEGARLLGSPSGDVWVLDNGELGRFAADTDDAKDRQAWEEKVQPVFLESCTPCHKPGGSGGADLSTYGAWVALRDRIEQKVVEEKTMPPAGIAITDAERQAIADWVAGAAP